MQALTPEQAAAIAQLAGQPLPPERREPAAALLAEVVTLAHDLDALDLDGVEPMALWRPPRSTS